MPGRSLSCPRPPRSTAAAISSFVFLLPALAFGVCGDNALRFGLIDEQTRRPVSCVDPGDAVRLQVLGPDLLPPAFQSGFRCAMGSARPSSRWRRFAGLRPTGRKFGSMPATGSTK
ncbi:MAG: hypothetical protein AAGN66_22165 [Acidobacteriota bacterium]